MTVKNLRRRIVLGVLALAGAGAIVFALLPSPVRVDLGEVTRGPLRVTVDEDGKTRVKERYVVSSPLSGRMERLGLKEGDAIEAGDTVLVVIEPADPELLDPRAVAQAEARVRAAEAAREQAAANLSRAEAALEFAQGERARIDAAFAKQGDSKQSVDAARMRETVAREDARAAVFARDIASFELDLARAALLSTTGDQPPDAQWRFEIRAPISGRVLRVVQESAAVVSPGTPIVEVGDPADLEIEVDVLSSDAVSIVPGAPAVIEHWGGEAPLHGTVRTVEPSAFTKVSALGVEEQRVNVIIDLTDPVSARRGLGDGFRVEARVVVWEHADCVRLPLGALFRRGGGWHVYAAEGGRARLRPVAVGRMGHEHAELLGGLEAGETVVLYPSDRVSDGARVRARRGGERLLER